MAVSLWQHHTEGTTTCTCTYMYWSWMRSHVRGMDEKAPVINGQFVSLANSPFMFSWYGAFRYTVYNIIHGYMYMYVPCTINFSWGFWYNTCTCMYMYFAMSSYNYTCTCILVCANSTLIYMYLKGTIVCKYIYTIFFAIFCD